MSSRFARAEIVAQATSAADALRRAAAQLEALAEEAPDVEPGTLRRRYRAIGIEVTFQLEGES